MLHCTKRCGRAGAAVRWFAAHRLTTLRDFLGGPSSLGCAAAAGRTDVALHEAVRARWRGVEVVRRAHPVDNTERLELDVDNTARLPSGAVKPSVAPRRPGRRNDASLHEAVRARWREVVHCARPVDDTARLDLSTDSTARLDLSADNTARLDLDTVAVKRSVPPRPRQQHDVALHQAVRAHWREAVRRTRPVDDTARLDLDVDDTARLPRGAVKPSVPREPR